jgi:hypothetical protein
VERVGLLLDSGRLGAAAVSGTALDAGLLGVERRRPRLRVHRRLLGTQVGYYGGINYGFGYTGEGYRGGYWRDGRFYYNRAINDLGAVHVASYANQALAPMNHISYNGGRGGVTASPTPAELAAARA